MKIDAVNTNMLHTSAMQQQKQKTDAFEKILKKASKQEEPKELMNACKQFETYFVHQLLKEMRSTIQPGGLVEKSRGEEIFEDMLDEEYAKNASEAGGIGLADMLYKQLSQKP
jgi:flagellar protein FlgJ